MTHRSLMIVGAALLCGALLSGCKLEPANPAPISPSEYTAMGTGDRRRHPDHFIVQYNLTRVHNPELRTGEREASLALVRQIGGMDGDGMAVLASLLRDPKCPDGLKEKILSYLLASNHPDLAAYVVPLLGRMKDDSSVKPVVLAYLRDNPSSTMLSGLVRAWAGETDVAGSNEASYRRAVQQITGRPWDQALLEEVNREAFPAKGQALTVLQKRLGSPTLRQRLLNAEPRSQALRTLQAFIEELDYLPDTPGSLQAAEAIYTAHRSVMHDVAKLAAQWSGQGYTFNIHDFYLLSRLVRDPLRQRLTREKLVLQLGQSIKSRQKNGDSSKGSNFWQQVDTLSTPDLWCLYLLDEMLLRSRVQIRLRMMADGDLEDDKSAWGGLIFYRNGQAEAIIYPPLPDVAPDDQRYQVSARLRKDAREVLCRFVGHFAKIENAKRAGPTAEELADAKANNYDGLILTRLNKKSVGAHYYTPTGKVISLGTYLLK